MFFPYFTNQEFTMKTQAKTLVSTQAKKLFAALLLTAVITPAWAATQTVKLSVPGMTCAACPFTVKKALSKVEGVSKTDVTFEKREAVVTFDDSKTSVQKLMWATEEAGYLSTVKE
jgi:mercuric ion binding protein